MTDNLLSQKMGCVSRVDNHEMPPLSEKRKRKYFRDQVIERDDKTCQVCGFKFSLGDLEVHHIHPFALGGEDSVENLVCLCKRCHGGAPKKGEDFLQYQKTGGKVWTAIALSVFEKASEEESPAEIRQSLNGIRVGFYGVYFYDEDVPLEERDGDYDYESSMYMDEPDFSDDIEDGFEINPSEPETKEPYKQMTIWG